MKKLIYILIVLATNNLFAQNINPCISGISQDSVIVDIQVIIDNPNISICDSNFKEIIYYRLHAGINGTITTYGLPRPTTITQDILTDIQKINDGFILENCLVVTDLKYLNKNGDTLSANNYKLYLTNGNNTKSFGGKIKVNSEKWKNGNLMKTEIMSNNRLIRKNTFYPSENKRTTASYYYMNTDTLINEKSYWKNGNTLSVINYKNGLVNGEHKYYYKGGELKRISTEENGFRVKEILYKKNGSIKEFSELNKTKMEVTMIKYKLGGFYKVETVYPYDFVTRKWK